MGTVLYNLKHSFLPIFSLQLCTLKKEWRLGGGATASHQLESEDLKKIKKVQSFFRGWLCRRRWKQIVDEYIKSPHAEAMRKRNRYVPLAHGTFDVKNI